MIKILFILLFSFFTLPTLSDETTFEDWLVSFKIQALKNDISEKNLDETM